MRKVPYFPQADDHVCGPASAQMALAAFDIHVPQEKLDHALETPRDPDKGTTTEAMVRVIQSYGLRSEIISPAEIQDIQNALAADMVVIICYSEPELNMGHYAIVQDISATYITLHDPYHGENFKLPRSEFEGRWQDRMFTNTTRWMMRVSLTTTEQ